ncbi:hypothetical protein KUTeg_006084 [Tegillarca granosa]|uniref:Ig-like domain-containing protein n=1 Tax=Tegillarca granosa TaxID=220873 RepID=A0ABQ9FFJ5_TEGGR|nr:hypothetical protein KUTeg_006084 [Tegillarca granosa]
MTYQGSGGQDLYQRYTYNCTSNRSYNLYISATQINSEDGSVWRCGDNDINLGSSGDYTLIVTDPPTADPVISGYSGTTAYVGNTFTLTCTLDGGKPLANLTWNCKGINVHGVNANTQTSAISRYTVTIDTSYNGQTCTCTASHLLWSKNKQVQSHPFVVHYNPVVTVGISPAYIRETDTFERPCTADGNPPPTISWTSNTSPSNASIFKLVTTMRNQTGDYTCRAQAQSKGPHGLLSGQAVLKVIVQFPPTVQAILEQASVIEGQTVYMYCLARGVPDQYTYGGWVQEYMNTLIRSANDFILSKNQQNLTLSGVTHQDIGTYRCKAHNAITDKYGSLYQHGTTNLVMNCKHLFCVYKLKNL